MNNFYETLYDEIKSRIIEDYKTGVTHSEFKVSDSELSFLNVYADVFKTMSEDGFEVTINTGVDRINDNIYTLYISFTIKLDEGLLGIIDN